MVSPDALRYEWITDSERFFALREPWDALGATAIETVFLTHAWLRCWLQELAPDAQLHLLTAWDGQQLVGALPLCGRPDDGRGRRWGFMGSGTLTPNHLDVIALPAVRAQVTEQFLRMLAEVRSQYDVLEFDKLPEDTETAGLVESAFADHALAVARETAAICPYSDLPSSMEAYMATRSHRVRRRVKQKYRRLGECCGPITFTLAQTPDEALEALSELIRLHQARWEARGYPGAFADPAVVRFHEALVVAALHDGYARLHTLRERTRTVAVAYDFRVGHSMQAYLDSFDPDFYELSPGVLIRYCVIENAIESGATRFDYLEGDEPHKADWCDERREDLRVTVFSRTPAGALARARSLAQTAAIDAARKWVPAETRAEVLKRLAQLKDKSAE